MEFFKELLYLNHCECIQEYGNKYIEDKQDREYFIKKYSKQNYVSFKIIKTNQSTNCVRMKHIISNVSCDHNL